MTFSGFRESKAGQQAGQISLSLFDLWCAKSLIPSPRQAAGTLAEEMAKRGLETPRDIARAVRDLGLGESTAIVAADAVATLSPADRLDLAAVATCAVARLCGHGQETLRTIRAT